MSDEAFDYDFMDGLRRLKPRLKNPEALRQAVLTEIKKNKHEEKKNQRKSSYLMRLTASILLLISIGNFAWQEGNMYYLRVQMQGRLMNTQGKGFVDYECQQSLRSLLIEMEKSTLGQFTDGKTIIITVQQLLYLQENDSPFLPDVKNFLSALKKFYPEKYKQFNQEGVLKLSVWQLKHDYRLCQWFN
ncbi:MAG: hypothetical protein JEZ14_23855 [Marinilabiliaceae bacterium]|nr:hypothetical protein [Marinilabiliaceae bacterium]